MKFWKSPLFFLTTLPLLAIPVVNTSCSALTTKNLKLFDASDVDTNINKEYNKLPNCNKSLNTLLRGDKHYNNGNYVIFFATSSCLSPQTIPNSFNDCFFNRNASFDNSIPIPPIADTPFLDRIKNDSDWAFDCPHYKFLVYFETDLYIDHGFKGDGGWKSNPTTGKFVGQPLCSPWDKYDDIATKHNKNYKTGKYVRNDKAAKQIRSISKTQNKLFDDKSIESAYSAGDSYLAIQWVKARPFVLDTRILNNQGNTFFDTINTNYKASINWKK